MIRPNMPAPEFEAEAYFLGNKTNIRLSEYQNNWVYFSSTRVTSPLFDLQNWQPWLSIIIFSSNLGLRS